MTKKREKQPNRIGRHLRILQKHLLLKIFNHLCFHCGKKLGKRTATRDHLIPRCEIKRKKNRDKITDLVLSCAPCNARKANRMPTQREIERAEKIHLDYRKS